MKNNNKGFTLIELLVVVAIIAILASIAITNLGSARQKGNDAKIKSQLANLRASAAVYADDHETFGGTGEVISDGNCAATLSGGIFNDPDVVRFITATNYPAPANGDIKCYNDGVSWAVAAKTSTGAWCVDYNGASQGKDTTGGVDYDATDGTGQNISNPALGAAPASPYHCQ